MGDPTDVPASDDHVPPEGAIVTRQSVPLGEIKTCPRCGEPVVFTFEFRGYEYLCVECAWKGDIFGPSASTATPERVARRDELAERYEVESAERAGRPAPTPPPQDVPRPVCKTCGAVAEGRLDHSGKPAHWFTRTPIGGVPEYACSRPCIDGPAMPW